MLLTPKQLETLIQEVELQDPIDYGDLPFDEDELRTLVARRLCLMMDSMQNMSDEDRQSSLLASVAKLVLENLVLNVQLLRRDGATDSAEQLLKRLRDGG
jgi:predicted Mrr-cat superfamily restriction endonuclease